jgi:predicted Zn-dependent protease
MRQKFMLVMVSLFLLASCATSGINRWQPNIISLPQEERLGKQFAEQVEKEHPLLRDAKGNAYVERLGRRLLEDVPEVYFDYTFKLVDSDELNAFALPGGYVYVNKGLIVAADNEAELAGVMAHEIGHVVARHGTERLTTRYGYNLALSLALGDNPDRWVALAANLFGKAGILAYSRSQESEADTLGVQTLYKAGYDPQAMATFFEKLLAQRERRATFLEKYLSSHPLTEDRIRHVNQLIGGFNVSRNAKLDTKEFQQIKTHLSTKYPPKKKTISLSRNQFGCQHAGVKRSSFSPSENMSLSLK